VIFCILNIFELLCILLTQAMAWARAGLKPATIGSSGLAWNFWKPEPSKARPKPWLWGQAGLEHHYLEFSPHAPSQLNLNKDGMALFGVNNKYVKNTFHWLCLISYSCFILHKTSTHAFINCVHGLYDRYVDYPKPDAAANYIRNDSMDLNPTSMGLNQLEMLKSSIHSRQSFLCFWFRVFGSLKEVYHC